MKICGFRLWGEEPQLPLRVAVEQRKAELERELIKLTMDHMDLGMRAACHMNKIEYLGKYLADRPVIDAKALAIERIYREASGKTPGLPKDPSGGARKSGE